MKKLSSVLLLLLISVVTLADLKGNITGICYQTSELANTWSSWTVYNRIIQFSSTRVEAITNDGSYVYFPVIDSEVTEKNELIIYASDINGKLVIFRLRFYQGTLQVYMYPYNSPTVLYQVENLIEF